MWDVGIAPRTLHLGTRGEWSVGRFRWSSPTRHEAGWVRQPVSALRSRKDLCPCRDLISDVPVVWRFVLPGLWCSKTGFGGWNIVLRESKGQEMEKMVLIIKYEVYRKTRTRWTGNIACKGDMRKNKHFNRKLPREETNWWVGDVDGTIT